MSSRSDSSVGVRLGWSRICRFGLCCLLVCEGMYLALGLARLGQAFHLDGNHILALIAAILVVVLAMAQECQTCSAVMHSPTATKPDSSKPSDLPSPEPASAVPSRRPEDGLKASAPLQLLELTNDLDAHTLTGNMIEIESAALGTAVSGALPDLVTGLMADNDFLDMEPQDASDTFPVPTSPAEFIMELLGQMLEGHVPDLEELEVLKGCLTSAGAQLFTPVSVKSQMQTATAMDADVEEALMTRLLGVSKPTLEDRASSPAHPLLPLAAVSHPATSNQNILGALPGIAEVLESSMEGVESLRLTLRSDDDRRHMYSLLMSEDTPLAIVPQSTMLSSKAYLTGTPGYDTTAGRTGYERSVSIGRGGKQPARSASVDGLFTHKSLSVTSSDLLEHTLTHPASKDFQPDVSSSTLHANCPLPTPHAPSSAGPSNHEVSGPAPANAHSARQLPATVLPVHHVPELPDEPRTSPRSGLCQVQCPQCKCTLTVAGLPPSTPQSPSQLSKSKGSSGKLQKLSSAVSGSLKKLVNLASHHAKEPPARQTTPPSSTPDSTHLAHSWGTALPEGERCSVGYSVEGAPIVLVGPSYSNRSSAVTSSSHMYRGMAAFALANSSGYSLASSGMHSRRASATIFDAIPEHFMLNAGPEAAEPDVLAKHSSVQQQPACVDEDLVPFSFGGSGKHALPKRSQSLSALKVNSRLRRSSAVVDAELDVIPSSVLEILDGKVVASTKPSVAGMGMCKAEGAALPCSDETRSGQLEKPLVKQPSVVARAQQLWAANQSPDPHMLPRAHSFSTLSTQLLHQNLSSHTDMAPQGLPLSQDLVKRSQTGTTTSSNSGSSRGRAHTALAHVKPASPTPALLDEVEGLLAAADTAFAFDAFHLSELTRGHALSVLGFFLIHRARLTTQFHLDETKLARWLKHVEQGYLQNPYHNATHAADVLQTLHVVLHQAGMVGPYVDPLMLLSCYLAAIIHDYQHLGVTNDYLINTSDPLAIRYNDRAPMENHHLAAAFMTLRSPLLNFTQHMPKTEFTKLRKNMIDLVLSTDMKNHFALVGQFNSSRRQLDMVQSLSSLMQSNSELPTLSSPRAPPLSPRQSNGNNTLLMTPSMLLATGSHRTSHSKHMSSRSSRMTSMSSLRSVLPNTTIGRLANSNRSSVRNRAGGDHWTIGTAPCSQEHDMTHTFDKQRSKSSISEGDHTPPRRTLSDVVANNGDKAPLHSADPAMDRMFLQSSSMKTSPMLPPNLQAAQDMPRYSGRNSYLAALDTLRVSAARSSGGPWSGAGPGSRGLGLMDPAHSSPAIVPLDDNERLLSIQIAFKLSDLGHIAEGLDVHLRWVAALEEEFFLQGDRERAAGLPISPLFDRHKPGVTKSQVGFIEVVVFPLFRAFVSSFPGAKPVWTGAATNYKYWKTRQTDCAAQ